MEKSQKSSANLILIAVIIVLAGVVGYFAFIKKSAAPITAEPTVQTKDITITFPKAGSVLVEGETYNITWSGSEVVSVNAPGISCVLTLENEKAGSISISGAATSSICAQKSFSWKVPSVLEYMKGGDHPADVAPVDGYQIRFYLFPGPTIENVQTYSSSAFKIIPKILVK